MDDLFGFGLILVVLAGVVIFMSIRDKRNKERIGKDIRRVGGEPVKISFQFVGYDRDNQHYKVQFADSLGRKHKTHCKVNIWNSSLYWQRTPVEFLGDLPGEEVRWRQIKNDPGSSKEQIIDDLVAENERLREQLVQAESLKGGFQGNK